MAAVLNEVAAWRQVFKVCAVLVGNEYLSAIGTEYYAATAGATKVTKPGSFFIGSVNIDHELRGCLVGYVCHS
jgi:hypothetical protein